MLSILDYKLRSLKISRFHFNVLQYNKKKNFLELFAVLELPLSSIYIDIKRLMVAINLILEQEHFFPTRDKSFLIEKRILNAINYPSRWINLLHEIQKKSFKLAWRQINFDSS